MGRGASSDTELERSFAEPPSDELIVTLRTEIRRAEFREFEDWDSGGCNVVSFGLEQAYPEVGWSAEAGYFIWPTPGEDGRYQAIDHYWLRLPDGSILDATADQFRRHGLDIGNVARVDPGDPLQDCYQRYTMHTPDWHRRYAHHFRDQDVAARGSCDDCEQ